MHSVRVDAEDLKTLRGLGEACEAAERHFHSCQSALFRNFLRSVWDAPNMHRVQERLSAALRASGPEAACADPAGENQPKNSGNAKTAEGGEGDEADGTGHAEGTARG